MFSMNSAQWFHGLTIQGIEGLLEHVLCFEFHFHLFISGLKE